MLLTLLPLLTTIILALSIDYHARGKVAEADLEVRTNAVISALEQDISRLIFQAPDRSFLTNINSRLMAFPSIERLFVFSDNGTPVHVYQQMNWSQQPPLDAPQVFGSHIANGKLFISSKRGNFATVIAQINRNSVTTAKARALRTNLGLAFLLGLVGLTAMILLQRTTTRRLVALEETAIKVVNTQDYTLRAVDLEQDELDHIAAALNKLLAEVEQTLKSLGERDERLRQEMLERDEGEKRRLELERQLHTSQKMDSLGRLAGGIAHDFNNLLAAILGQAEILEVKHPGSGASLIVNVAQRASELTGQLLSFSKSTPIEFHYVTLKNTLEELESLLALVIPSNIDVQLHVPPDIWGVHADEGRIQQTLLNLAINAKDAMPQGGNITLSAKNLEGKEKDGAQDFVQIKICDTGHGMDAETLQQAMDPFYTTKGVDGTGLGLSVAHGIIQQFGGTLSLTSTINEGTTVLLTLPRSDEPTPQVPVDPHAPPDESGTSTILLVEDQKELRDVTTEMLKRGGYKVLVAPNGGEATTYWNAEHAEFDLVITDMIMAEMSGQELAQRVLKDHPTMPIILVSGYVKDSEITALCEQGNVSFLPKPFRAETLLKLLKLRLNSARLKEKHTRPSNQSPVT